MHMAQQTRLARSLLDRVFGGVCGGISAYLGVNPWWARALLVILTVLSGGVAALLYLILWWTMPVDLTPEIPHPGRSTGTLLLVGLAIVLIGGIIAARGMGLFSGPSGADLFWPGVVIIIGAALFLRELRG